MHFTATSEKTDSIATQEANEKKAEKGEKTAEKIRFGEKISEEGFGGETVGNDGRVGGGSDGSEDAGKARREMGYEDKGGDNVGA